MEHVERELCAVVAFSRGGVEIAEVGGHAGNAQHAGLLVEDVQHLVDADAIFIHNELDDAAVQITAAGAHRQADQRGEAHGGVDALAAVDRADGAAVAHVAGDELQLLDGLAHQLRAAGGHIAVAGAVETVAADAIVLVIFIRDGVHISLAGHGLVERGVEHGDHRHVTHDLAAGFDAGDVGGIVQRREWDALLQRGHDGIVDFHGGSELLTAVDDTVADCVDLLHRGDHAVLGARQLVDNSGDGFRMRGHCEVFVKHRLAADERGVFQMTVDADALAQALGQDRLGLHVDQLILQGGAAGVDDKNFHTQNPFLSNGIVKNSKQRYYEHSMP